MLTFVEASSELKHLFQINENYLKAIWSLIALFKSDTDILKKVLSLLNVFIDARSNSCFSRGLLEYAKSIIEDSEKEINCANELKTIHDLLVDFESRKGDSSLKVEKENFNPFETTTEGAASSNNELINVLDTSRSSTKSTNHQMPQFEINVADGFQNM